MEVLDLTLRGCEERSIALSDEEVDLCSEILKILFNITVALEKKSADEVSIENINCKPFFSFYIYLLLYYICRFLFYQ